MTASDTISAAGCQKATEPVTNSLAGVSLDLTQLVDLHGAAVQRYCASMVADRDTAIELAQDVFVVAIESSHRFRHASSAETWLLGIASRICRNWIRRRAIQRRVFGIIARSIETQDSCQQQKNIQDAELYTALHRLSAKDREILVLRYIEGKELVEVSQILNISRSATDQRLSRARRRLAEQLE